MEAFIISDSRILPGGCCDIVEEEDCNAVFIPGLNVRVLYDPAGGYIEILGTTNLSRWWIEGIKAEGTKTTISKDTYNRIKSILEKRGAEQKVLKSFQKNPGFAPLNEKILTKRNVEETYRTFEDSIRRMYYEPPLTDEDLDTAMLIRKTYETLKYGDNYRDVEKGKTLLTRMNDLIEKVRIKFRKN
jgi:hypothetical protein